MKQIKSHFLEGDKVKEQIFKSIDSMDQSELDKKVDPDMQIAYAIDSALRSINKVLEEGKGCRELSLVKTKLQEAEFWLFKIHL